MSDIYSDSVYVQIKSPCKTRFPCPLSFGQWGGASTQSAHCWIHYWQITITKRCRVGLVGHVIRLVGSTLANQTRCLEFVV